MTSLGVELEQITYQIKQLELDLNRVQKVYNSWLNARNAGDTREIVRQEVMLAEALQHLFDYRTNEKENKHDH